MEEQVTHPLVARAINGFRSSGLPGYMEAGIIRFLTHGIRCGDFLDAVLCNDLSRAVAHADGNNMYCITDWVVFCSNYLPSICWGSESSVRRWRGTTNSNYRGDA